MGTRKKQELFKEYGIRKDQITLFESLDPVATADILKECMVKNYPLKEIVKIYTQFDEAYKERGIESCPETLLNLTLRVLDNKDMIVENFVQKIVDAIEPKPTPISDLKPEQRRDMYRRENGYNDPPLGTFGDIGSYKKDH